MYPLTEPPSFDFHKWRQEEDRKERERYEAKVAMFQAWEDQDRHGIPIPSDVQKNWDERC